MAKISFDIKYRQQIESGEFKVETRDGRTARIICWDSKAKDARYDTRPIIALVTTPIPGLESLIQCGENGILYKDAKDMRDLFIVTPEPELTEFEKAFDSLAEAYHSDKNPDDVACCKEYASELLSLARKQLQPEIDAEIEKSYKTADEVQYRKGREEALKDLPRWKKANGKERFSERMIVLAGDNDLLCTNYAEEGEYYISFSSIEKLPKEDQTWK